MAQHTASGKSIPPMRPASVHPICLSPDRYAKGVGVHDELVEVHPFVTASVVEAMGSRRRRPDIPRSAIFTALRLRRSRAI